MATLGNAIYTLPEMQVATASNAVWPLWNGAYAATQTSSGATRIYGNQTGVYGPQQSAYGNQSTGIYAVSTRWVTWNVTYVNGAALIQTGIEQPTAEQVAAQQERKRRRESADSRADRLLKSILTTAQRTQYERDRCFEVITGRTGQMRVYRIKHGWAGNVFLLDAAGREVEKLCIHPNETVPIADNLVAQKFLLEADEEMFRRTANKTRLLA